MKTKLIKIFAICTMLIFTQNISAGDFFSQKATLIKIKKLIKKEELIAKAIERYLVREGKYPTIAELKTPRYLTAQFSETNFFGGNIAITNQKIITNIPTDLDNFAYDYYLSETSRDYTFSPTKANLLDGKGSSIYFNDDVAKEYDSYLDDGIVIALDEVGNCTGTGKCYVISENKLETSFYDYTDGAFKLIYIKSNTADSNSIVIADGVDINNIDMSLNGAVAYKMDGTILYKNDDGWGEATIANQNDQGLGGIIAADGLCGSAHDGSSVSSEPTTNLCGSGTNSTVSYVGGYYKWTCNGTNSGGYANCGVQKTGEDINAICGTAENLPISIAPTSDLCSAGLGTQMTTSEENFNWTCEGSGTGTDVNCTTTRTIMSNGVCASINNTSIASLPTIISALCTEGNAVLLSEDSENFNWSCVGDADGTDVNCSAKKIINAQCGVAANVDTENAPDNHLCNIGTASSVSNVGSYYIWSCEGSNGGTNEQCRAEKEAGSAGVSTSYFKDIEAGYGFTCGIKNNDKVYCWGYSDEGRLGNDDATNTFIPTKVTIDTDKDAVSLSVGEKHACVITTDGDAYCWGEGDYFQLGDNGNKDNTTPIKVNGSHNWIAISAGEEHTCGITTDGNAYCWGEGEKYQLGNDSEDNNRIPAIISGDHNFTNIQSGQEFSCGTTVDDDYYCWGHYWDFHDDWDDDNEYSHIPTLVSDYKILAGGVEAVCGIRKDTNDTHCWGLMNFYGQLGINAQGDTTEYNTMENSKNIFGDHKWKKISASKSNEDCCFSAQTVCGIDTQDDAYCWGFSHNGQTGAGIFTSESSHITIPMAVSGGHKWSKITVGLYHVCGLTTDNKAYCWGANQWGELGNTQKIIGSVQYASSLAGKGGQSTPYPVLLEEN